MKRDEILSMPAGREMDALIAEKVILLENVGVRTFGGAGTHLFYSMGDYPFALVPRYSRDIAAAWEVVDKICIPAPEDCWTGPTFQLNHDKSQSLQWQAIFSELDSLDGVLSWSGEQYADVCAESAPLAICRAALLAVEGAE